MQKKYGMKGNGVEWNREEKRGKKKKNERENRIGNRNRSEYRIG